MNAQEYENILGSIESARQLHRRLNRNFYKFGFRIYQIMTEQDRDFIEDLEIEPIGNFQQNDGSVEDTDTLLLRSFSLRHLGVKYDFDFSTIPAGEADLVRGEILVRTKAPIDQEGFVELTRLSFDETGKLIDGPKVDNMGRDNITTANYCRGFIAQLIYDHIIGT